MLAAFLAGSGAEIVDLGLLPDRRDIIAATLAGATGCDAIIASGGVSGSEADHLLGALRDAGGEGTWTAIALMNRRTLLLTLGIGCPAGATLGWGLSEWMLAGRQADAAGRLRGFLDTHEPVDMATAKIRLALNSQPAA